jgi:hypothetical protein
LGLGGGGNAEDDDESDEEQWQRPKPKQNAYFRVENPYAHLKPAPAPVKIFDSWCGSGGGAQTAAAPVEALDDNGNPVSEHETDSEDEAS